MVLDAPLGVETGTSIGYGLSSSIFQPSLEMSLYCAAASLEAAYDVVHSSLQN